MLYLNGLRIFISTENIVLILFACFYIFNGCINTAVI